MKKLLVVDDEAKIREVIKEYAEFSGYEVTEAGDGMSAIGLCKLNDYDLIIMDVMMPKLDGFSSVKEIKKIDQGYSCHHALRQGRGVRQAVRVRARRR